MNERSSWAVLAIAGAAFVLLGGLASLALPRFSRRREGGLMAGLRGADFGRELGRARSAATRGLGSTAEGMWDVLLEGADAARARAKVVRDVGDSLRETGSSLRRAVGHLGGSVLGFVFGTITAIGFLAGVAAVLMMVYLPERDRRERFLTQVRSWLSQR